ncbi:helix-turn-helix domain-containing protein [Burkholderia ubonensis]|uniref:helix-turn-helix domain-containing protein n=1 Tax=Burkholderia ubonensis TaxID=101571 RepID=UPI000AA893F2|nr:LysR family transcriptional regulator [Burkholderia ubonensis]
MNKFSDMSTFVAVVESGSFSEAARRLGMANRSSADASSSSRSVSAARCSIWGRKTKPD